CPDVGGSVTINGSFNSGRGAGGTGPGGSGDEIEIEDGGEYESGGGQAGGGTPAVSLPNNLLNALENALTGLQNYLSGGITDDCSQNVIGKLSANLGFDLSAFKVYLAQGATFYDATRSNIPVAGNVMPRRPADLLYGPGATIADVFRNSPGTNAMTSIMTSTLTIFLRPGRDANRTPVVDRSNGGNNSRNLSLLFHEALHGFTKKVDADIQSSLGLGSGSSSNVTEYIKMHCF
ncbi:MAG TPA: hypothetical protein VNI77_03160, partial [Nitrososphaera sp.]|nr:hypothetical protein [Nitrososphaera sp.]